MILIVNCNVIPADRDRFSRAVVPKLADIAGRPVREVPLEQLADFEFDPDCTHVVISGSELSAARRQPTDDALIALIQRAVRHNRVVLGICYGSQMMARALVDDGACRRAETPEFGFKAVRLTPDPLFSGIECLTAVHAHQDEVTGLPSDRFEVIASTDHCAVQAWRLVGRPVWGVQFHPELDEPAGRELLAGNLGTYAMAREHYVDELEDRAHLDAGRRIFENFFGTAL